MTGSRGFLRCLFMRNAVVVLEDLVVKQEEELAVKYALELQQHYQFGFAEINAVDDFDKFTFENFSEDFIGKIKRAWRHKF